VRYAWRAVTIGALPAGQDLGLPKGWTHGVHFQARQGFGAEPKGEQAKQEIKEQARKPENRRKLKNFGQRHMKRR